MQKIRFVFEIHYIYLALGTRMERKNALQKSRKQETCDFH